MSEIQEQNTDIEDSNIHVTGGCHCGAVKFEAKVTKCISILECNCSICSMTGFKHLIVAHENFELIAGKDKLSNYRFNSQQANHLFCSICGVKSFYQPRSHPDSWSIHIHCIDDFDPERWTFVGFDGKNWEQAKQNLES